MNTTNTENTDAMWKSLADMVDAWDRQPAHVVDRYLNQEAPDNLSAHRSH